MSVSLLNMELDKEETLNELMNFEKNGGRDFENGLPECLERFLINVAKSGDVMYPWSKIKPVIIKKIELVVNEFNAKYPYENNPALPNVKSFNFQEMKNEIIEKFNYFYGAPFTIQRICELLTSPYKHYKRSDKFMRGLEKNVRVVSTIEAKRSDDENESSPLHKEFARPSSTLKNNASSSSPSASSSANALLSSPLPSFSTNYMNGLNEKEESRSQLDLRSDQMSQSCSLLQDHGSLPNSPAPLQQLDSFTTVFASPPSTPLAVVSDIHSYDSGSPSSSSSSSSESSPQPSSSTSPPPCLSSEVHDMNHAIADSDYENNLPKDDSNNNVMDNKSDSENSKIDTIEPINVMEPVEPMEQTDENKYEETSETTEELIKPEVAVTDVSKKVEETEQTVEATPLTANSLETTNEIIDQNVDKSKDSALENLDSDKGLMESTKTTDEVPLNSELETAKEFSDDEVKSTDSVESTGQDATVNFQKVEDRPTPPILTSIEQSPELTYSSGQIDNSDESNTAIKPEVINQVEDNDPSKEASAEEATETENKVEKEP